MTNYIIHTKVSAIEQRYEQVYVSGVGDSTVFEQRSLGWFVWLRGSYESIHIGEEHPGWKVEDKVKITMEKVI